MNKKFYFEDEEGFKMRDTFGDEIVTDTIEEAEQWIMLYHQIFPESVFSLYTDDGTLHTKYYPNWGRAMN